MSITITASKKRKQRGVVMQGEVLWEHMMAYIEYYIVGSQEVLRGLIEQMRMS
jgi:hypothetical protein